MAEQLSNFEKPLPKSQKYPWNTWMRPGTTWRLIRGVDFDEGKNIANLKTRIHQVAKERGLKATSYIEQVMKGDELVDALVFTTERAKFGPVDRYWAEPEPAVQEPVKPAGRGLADLKPGNGGTK